MKLIALLLLALVPVVAYQGKTALPVPQFKIVHTAQGLRFDGGTSFYVLISKPNLQTAEFKDDIKGIIKRIVADQGGKISIDIYDDAAVLERKYQADKSPRSAP